MLDRDPSPIEELIRDVEPFYQEVDDERGTGEDSRGAVMRWRREQNEIAAEVRDLYTKRPIDIRREVSKSRRKKLERQARLARIGPGIEEAVQRRLNHKTPPNRDRRFLPGEK